MVSQINETALNLNRHSGRDCRNPDYMDVFEPTIHGLDTRFPAGMTVLVHNVI